MLQRNESSFDPEVEVVRSVLNEAAQRPWLAALLMRRPPNWLTRLARLARRVWNLPHHTRRVLRRKLAAGLTAAALLLALAGPPQAVYAASITVNGDGTGGTCSLYDAINSANTDTANGNCPAGSGADTITLTVDVNLTAALPYITSDIILEGQNHTIAGNNTNFRVLTIQSGNVTLNQATISGGNAIRGGGIYNEGTLTVTNSTVSGNTASAYGGGGINNQGTLTVRNSTLSGNTASASGGGGGIINFLGTATVQNSTLSGNSSNFGGGIANFMGTATVQNSLVALQASGADCYGTITSQGFNIESATTCNFTGTGDQRNVGAASLKMDSTLANNGTQPHPDTLKLNAGSAAIDQIPIGTNGCGTTITTDERGGVRANGAAHGGTACDVGAYEYDSSQNPTAVTLRDLTATTNTPIGLLGVLGAALAGLGALVFRRQPRLKFR